MGLHLIIVGGESGPGARPCNVEWIRSIIKQCADAAVPVFTKQVGSNATASYYDHDLKNWYDQEGFDWPDPIGWHESDGQPMLNARIRFETKDKKGGDPAEWPEDLRVRQMPEVRP